MPAQDVRIVLDVRLDGEEISGHASDGVVQPKPFLGWLGLIAALDALLAVPRPPAAESVARVCVAFANAEDAEAFAASANLRDAIREAGQGAGPEIWFTRSQTDPRHHDGGN
jgi:hypothetical protein